MIMKYCGVVVSVLVWFLVFVSLVEVNKGQIPTTLDGPFKPVTVPLDQSFRGHAVDLPDNDPRVQRTVKGFEPEQISVSLSSTYDSLWISWVTGEYQIGGKIKPLDPSKVGSVVQYGKDKSSLRRKAIGQSLIYNQLYPFEGLQNYTSGIIHHVQLTGLKPATLYYYRCGDPYIPAMSSIYHFKTMPISSSTSYPKRIAIVGDLGLTYNTTSTLSHLTGNNPDLVLLVGDVTYANLYLTNGTGSDCYSCSFPDTPIHETYQPRWDYWGRYMQPLVSKIPIMVVEGNHEIEEQVGNQTFAAYRSRFAFPSKESGSSSPFYYSFNAGGIHFIMLGGYVAYNKSDDQYKWLEKDLANVDRTVTPWLIATWHPPWYSTYTAHYREAECMKVAMEELLYEYGVDLVFNGHVHAYERTNRVYKYKLDPCGPVHITVGDGGNREKMAIGHADEPGKCPEPASTPDKFMGGFCAYNFTSGPAAGNFCWDQQPEYSAYRESSFGHGILEVKNETHALWTWHRNQDMYNKAGDIIYIVRQPDKCLVKTKGESEQRWHEHITSFMTEILLALKEANKKTRQQAYGILVQIGHACGYEEKGGSKENLQQFFNMIAGGLAGKTPHMISATVKGLTCLAYEFTDLVSAVCSLLPSVFLLLKRGDKEINKANLGLLKVLITKSPVQGLQAHLRSMVEALLGWQDNTKNHFKAKVKVLIDMLIKKCGLNAVKEVMPEEHMKLLTNIRKFKQRRERKLASNSEDSRSHMSKATTKRLSRWNNQNIFSEFDNGESESSEAEYMTMKTIAGHKSKASLVSDSKASELWSKKTWKAAKSLQDDLFDQLADEPLDLLDQKKTRSALTASGNLKRKPGSEDEAEIDSEGRLIIHEGTRIHPPTDYSNVWSEAGSCFSETSRRTQKRRKTFDSGWAYTGTEYASKKAGGDVRKKDKLEPYAYCPLDRKMMSRRPEHQAVARKGMSSIVRLTNKVEGKSSVSMKGVKSEKRKPKA